MKIHSTLADRVAGLEAIFGAPSKVKKNIKKYLLTLLGARKQFFREMDPRGKKAVDRRI